MQRHALPFHVPVSTLAAPQVQQHLHLTCAQSLARLRLTAVCSLLVQVGRAVTVCDHEAVQVDARSGPDAKERLREPSDVPHWLRTPARHAASLSAGRTVSFML